jgi:predicted deacylase
MKNIILGIVALLLIGGGIYFLMNQTSDTVVIVEENEETLPVEPDGGIGDGAEPLNEVIAQERGPESVIGTSVAGADITAYHFGTGANEILFVGGTHGSDAPSTGDVAEQLVTYLAENPAIVPSDVSVTVIPTLNPDGAAKSGSAGRFNANDVDLNRNFDCEWSATGVWRDQEVSGGSRPFSEPETQALQAYVNTYNPAAAVVWFASEGKVYPSACAGTPSTESVSLAAIFANAAGYPVAAEFNAYAITGDMVNWMAQQDIPAISVLLTSRTNAEWTKNKAGIEAILNSYSN